MTGSHGPVAKPAQCMQIIAVLAAITTFFKHLWNLVIRTDPVRRIYEGRSVQETKHQPYLEFVPQRRSIFEEINHQ
jgi:hypothetical protein